MEGISTPDMLAYLLGAVNPNYGVALLAPASSSSISNWP
jgi:hypothetical protein